MKHLSDCDFLVAAAALLQLNVASIDTPEHLRK